MSRLYEGRKLAPALVDSRRRSLEVYSLLRERDWTVPQLPTVNPPMWELAHLAWFQELWCVRTRGAPSLARRSESLLPGADGLFDSSAVPHDSRWSLPYPSREVLLAYLRGTLDATLQALAEDNGERRYYFELSLLHEDMHGEALLMTLQTLGLPAPEVMPPASRVAARGDVEFAGATFTMGSAADAPGFVFDNERECHDFRVDSFAMARSPVTQGEFRDFVDDGGYGRGSLWSAPGQRWLTLANRKAPAHWQREGDAWRVRRFDQWIALDPDLPMMHVNLHEAEAWCRWAGRRLPTEAEWEFAATNGGTEDRFPWGDEAIEEAGRDHGLDVLASRKGLHGLLGGVWEWTSSPFLPYPGFRAGPYRDYSQPWFRTHHVLRGGSFATRHRLIHNRWRNFYTPDRCDAFAGFRTCAVER